MYECTHTGGLLFELAYEMDFVVITELCSGEEEAQYGWLLAFAFEDKGAGGVYVFEWAVAGAGLFTRVRSLCVYGANKRAAVAEMNGDGKDRKKVVYF